MSMGEIILTKQCKCGRLFETDRTTLGVNKKKCGIFS